MRFHPTRIYWSRIFLCFLLPCLLILSCTKDSDILSDATFNATEKPVNKGDSQTDSASDETTEDSTEEETPSDTAEETPADDPADSPADETDGGIEEGFAPRSTAFPPTDDVYLQSGKAFNEPLIRLEEGNRTSYLMFDLSPIAEIGGYITDVNFQFTVTTDGGDGEIAVYRGVDTNWDEASIASNTAPENDIRLGAINDNYVAGSTQEIVLSASDITPEKTTLILYHANGNDLALASKEHPSKAWPKLIVTYNAPEDAPAIEVEDPQPADTGSGSTGDTTGGDSGTTENAAPQAVAAATPLSGQAPLQVAFEGKDSSDDNAIQSYRWDFKDGSSSNSINPTHTFTAAGTYNVVLTVTDAQGLTDTASVTITVEAAPNEAPVANAQASVTSGEAPLTVQFSSGNSTDDKEIVSYFWDFGTNDPSSAKNPSRTFTEPGEYVVTLTVTDAEGLKDSDSVTITVNEAQSAAQNQAPTAKALASVLSGQAPLEVAFNANNSTDDNGIVSYYWDFSTNDPSSAKNPVRTFATPGEYLVTLTVTDAEGLTDSDTLTITVTGSSSGGDTGGSTGGSTGGGSSDIPPGAVLASSFGWNATDATQAFENALNSSHATIVIDKQAGDWIIRPTRIGRISNKTIIFEPGVVLRAKPGAYPTNNSRMLDFFECNNITIEGYGATMRMNKNEYTSGEGRHALVIEGSNNVTIRGLTIRDSGGDGIYIGSGVQGYSRNITVEDVLSTNNRRQGMSIISAQDVYVRNSTFENSNGTLPETGVDLEPNEPSERLVNINFSNCKFSGNDNSGFLVSVQKMNASSLPLSVTVRDSEFSMNARSSDNPSIRAEIRLVHGDQANPVKGNITFDRIAFRGSHTRLIYSKKSGDAFSVTFRDCVATNVLQRNDLPAIDLQTSPSVMNSIGGWTFQNFYLQYNANQPFLRFGGPDYMVIKNINGTFTIDEPYNNPIRFQYGISLDNAINTNINYNHVN
ncbi:PKD domain-containing protein [Robiginitalea sediminis]|uniref:PKD domain-containing protein n=1 Tax=Robiginitalea sediminis TaxID=1982593 RepID=UPI0013039CCF|nr:PKD domain-containing protein [Robiginitalea sediminis]